MFYHNLFYLTVKIQSLRTSFREEVRKVKKSQGTGKRVSEIYVPTWKFCEQCKFLEDVIMLRRPTVPNVCSPCDSSNTYFDNDADIANENEPAQVRVPNSADVQPPKKKKLTATWMETAANTLSNLENSSTTEDEWDIFGKDVANSIRSLRSVHLERKAKFAVQQVLFKVSDSATALPAGQSIQYSQVNADADAFNYQPLQTIHYKDLF